MVVYAPGTQEKDHQKQNMALQEHARQIDVSTASIATNTASIATLNASYPASKVTGTTTNDNASAGNIGEFISSAVAAGSPVSLTTNTAKDVTSISLTAGDWDVEGNVGFAPAGTTTQSVAICWISLTSATLPAAPNNGAYNQVAASMTTGAGSCLPTGKIRISVASTTTVYLGAFSTFGVSTNGAYGFIGARRAR